MLRRWLTDRIEFLVGRMVPRMPAEHREWGEAVVAEFAAIPPGERRLRWALGGLWFVLRRRAVPPTVGWPSRLFSAIGVLTVLPWALFSIQGISETDAPDGTLRSMVAMLVAQGVLMVAFVVACWPWRPARLLIVVALLGYATTAAFGAADNNGYPLLAAVIFVLPPTMAAIPILVLGVVGRRLGSPPG
jgi:hypothetical protein